MMELPFVGRLGAWEWPMLVLSLLLVVLESVVAFITAVLPFRVIDWFESLTRKVLTLVPSHGARELSEEPALIRLVARLAAAPGFVEICRIYGYEAEEHIVRTSDGYLLGIHRIGGPKGSNWRLDAQTPHRAPKPVVYLHHGLLMNSEVWVSVTDPRRALPFVLADLGYDVWLGNNRGNKYSKKHVFHTPADKRFWDFSIDEFALYDIPDTIEYVLSVVKQPDLAYIGFSQGSAQGFAALSISPVFNTKVRLFIALAPAMAPPGLGNRIVDSLVRASPSLMYLFFGRKAILRSTTFWQSIMFPPLYVRTIDASLDLLFRWKCKNISYAQKMVAYPHLYSYTSVKSVVHWFQIIRSGRFHMYDDEIDNPLQKHSTFYKVAPFPTQNIVSPIVLIYGKADSLVSIKTMLSELPSGTSCVGVPGHEHLDLLWGDNVDTLIFPYILSALRRTSTRRSSFAGPVISDKPDLSSPSPEPESAQALARQLIGQPIQLPSQHNPTLTNHKSFDSFH